MSILYTAGCWAGAGCQLCAPPLRAATPAPAAVAIRGQALRPQHEFRRMQWVFGAKFSSHARKEVLNETLNKARETGAGARKKVRTRRGANVPPRCSAGAGPAPSREPTPRIPCPVFLRFRFLCRCAWWSLPDDASERRVVAEAPPNEDGLGDGTAGASVRGRCAVSALRRHTRWTWSFFSRHTATQLAPKRAPGGAAAAGVGGFADARV